MASLTDSSMNIPPASSLIEAGTSILLRLDVFALFSNSPDLQKDIDLIGNQFLAAVDSSHVGTEEAGMILALRDLNIFSFQICQAIENQIVLTAAEHQLLLQQIHTIVKTTFAKHIAASPIIQFDPDYRSYYDNGTEFQNPVDLVNLVIDCELNDVLDKSNQDAATALFTYGVFCVQGTGNDLYIDIPDNNASSLSTLVQGFFKIFDWSQHPYLSIAAVTLAIVWPPSLIVTGSIGLVSSAQNVMTGIEMQHSKDDVFATLGTELVGQGTSGIAASFLGLRYGVRSLNMPNAPTTSLAVRLQAEPPLRVLTEPKALPGFVADLPESQPSAPQAPATPPSRPLSDSVLAKTEYRAGHSQPWLEADVVASPKNAPPTQTALLDPIAQQAWLNLFWPEESLLPQPFSSGSSAAADLAPSPATTQPLASTIAASYFAAGATDEPKIARRTSSPLKAAKAWLDTTFSNELIPAPSVYDSQDAKAVSYRNLDIDASLAKINQGRHADRHLTREDLRSILDNTFYISKDDFLAVVTGPMFENICDFVDGEPYVLILGGPGKSQDRIYALLSQLPGFPVPYLVIESDFDNTIANLPPGMKFVIADDVAYSGATIADYNLNSLKANYPYYDSSHILVTTVGISDEALSLIALTENHDYFGDIQVWSYYDIPNLTEVLSPDVYDHLERWMQPDNYDSLSDLEKADYDLSATNFLGFIYNKFPDNYPIKLAEELGLVKK